MEELNSAGLSRRTCGTLLVFERVLRILRICISVTEYYRDDVLAISVLPSTGNICLVNVQHVCR